MNLSWVRGGKVGVLSTKKMNDRLAEIPAIEIWAQKKTPDVFARSQVHVHPARPAITTLRFQERGQLSRSRGLVELLVGLSEGLAGFIEMLAGLSEGLAGLSEGLCAGRGLI